MINRIHLLLENVLLHQGKLSLLSCNLLDIHLTVWSFSLKFWLDFTCIAQFPIFVTRILNFKNERLIRKQSIIKWSFLHIFPLKLCFTIESFAWLIGLLKFPNLQPQSPLRSYPVEAIGSLSCTKDGLYLAGGALSGNAYFWEVSKNSIKLPCSIVLCKRNILSC